MLGFYFRGTRAGGEKTAAIGLAGEACWAETSPSSRLGEGSRRGRQATQMEGDYPGREGEENPLRLPYSGGDRGNLLGQVLRERGLGNFHRREGRNQVIGKELRSKETTDKGRYISTGGAFARGECVLKIFVEGGSELEKAFFGGDLIIPITGRELHSSRKAGLDREVLRSIFGRGG